MADEQTKHIGESMKWNTTIICSRKETTTFALVNISQDKLGFNLNRHGMTYFSNMRPQYGYRQPSFKV